jgi:hypothetical protein
MGACVALLAALPAYGQVRERVREDVRVRPGASTVKVRKVTDIIGNRVTVRDADALGKVVDIVISEDGCIDYLIVRYEEDFIAVPWGVVTYDVGERIIRVDTAITRARLRDVTFREGRWPDFTSERWRTSVRTVWGDRALRRGHDVGRPGDRRPGDVRPGDRRPGDVRPPDRRPPDRRPGDVRPPDRPPDRRPVPPEDRKPERPKPGDRGTDRGPGERPPPSRTPDRDVPHPDRPTPRG